MLELLDYVDQCGKAASDITAAIQTVRWEEAENL